MCLPHLDRKLICFSHHDRLRPARPSRGARQSERAMLFLPRPMLVGPDVILELANASCCKTFWSLQPFEHFPDLSSMQLQHPVRENPSTWLNSDTDERTLPNRAVTQENSVKVWQPIRVRFGYPVQLSVGGALAKTWWKSVRSSLRGLQEPSTKITKPSATNAKRGSLRRGCAGYKTAPVRRTSLWLGYAVFIFFGRLLTWGSRFKNAILFYKEMRLDCSPISLFWTNQKANLFATLKPASCWSIRCSRWCLPQILDSCKLSWLPSPAVPAVEWPSPGSFLRSKIGSPGWTKWSNLI